MVQEFHVLKCYSCGIFQVHIVKKSNKWCCKICNNKQTIVKVFGQGTGKDCRLHVQKLNEISQTAASISAESIKSYRTADNADDNYDYFKEEFDTNDEQLEEQAIQQPNKRSKWEKYVTNFDGQENNSNSEHHQLVPLEKCKPPNFDEFLNIDTEQKSEKSEDSFSLNVCENECNSYSLKVAHHSASSHNATETSSKNKVLSEPEDANPKRTKRIMKFLSDVDHEAIDSILEL